MKVCETCRTLFAPGGRAHRYCSVACRPSKRPAYPDGRRKCLTCGAVFTRGGRAQRYCSEGCRESNWLEYKRRKTADRRRLLPPGPGPRQPDPVQRATVLALRQAGLTLAAIGQRMGVSKQRVHQILSAIPGATRPR